MSNHCSGLAGMALIREAALLRADRPTGERTSAHAMEIGPAMRMIDFGLNTEASGLEKRRSENIATPADRQLLSFRLILFSRKDDEARYASFRGNPW